MSLPRPQGNFVDSLQDVLRRIVPSRFKMKKDMDERVLDSVVQFRLSGVRLIWPRLHFVSWLNLPLNHGFLLWKFWLCDGGSEGGGKEQEKAAPLGAELARGPVSLALS